MLARAVARIEDGLDDAEAGDLPASFMPWVATLLIAAAVVPMLAAPVRLRRRSQSQDQSQGRGQGQGRGLARGQPQSQGQSRPDDSNPDGGIDWRFVASAVFVLLVTFWTMRRLGYIPGAIVIVVGFMVLGRAGRLAVAVSALALPLGLWLLFSRLLGFPLP